MEQNIHETKNKARTFTLFKRLILSYILPYKFQALGAIVFMAISGAMTALTAALLQPVLDDVLNNGEQSLIFPVALGFAGAFAMRGIATYLHTVMMNRVGHSIVADIQTQLFSHFMTLDLAFFHNHSSGELISRVINDVSVLRNAITNTLTGFGKNLFTLFFLIALMFYRDWVLTLAAFVVFPLLSIFVIYLGKKLRKVSRSIQSELGGLSGILTQTFHGIRLIKAYCMEGYEKNKSSKAIHAVRDLNIKSVKISSLSTPVNEVIVGIIFAAIIIYGGYQVSAGLTTSGQLASFIAAFTLAYEPMKKLAKLNNTLQMGLGASERVFAMLDTRGSIHDKSHAIPLDTRRATISFEKVSFAYENSDTKALSNIDFISRPDQVTALVGPSGGGKSTLINLIPRFYDVENGAIKINDHDIRDLKLRSLRRHIALVSQDIMIFNDTVFENIRYGSPDASAYAVYSAAKAAAAHTFIQALDEGYDTVVGENGVKLSGGQKQRISIARAILCDAPILLLDEATSALDNESEHIIQDALKMLQKGRNTLVIAHRLSTVQDADQILVLDQGQIVERGSHHDLMALGGLYAHMHQAGSRD
ncbi:MAG: ABC transporter ATP-binding protein [Alphaproteobacteria bacterium]